MQGDPGTDWQQLAEHYREMYDGELLNLAADSADLTEVARQVLEQELRKRGLEDLRAAGKSSNGPIRPAVAQSGAGVDLTDAREFVQDEDLPPEYTWKTVLCECDGREEALQLSEMLKQAGIESWIERPGSRRAIVWDERMVGGLQVLVAADQLDEAREIAARPIPKEIIEESKVVAPEFESPPCPACDAGDP